MTNNPRIKFFLTVGIVLITVATISRLSYSTGEINAKLECIDSTMKVVDSLNSEISLLEIEKGRLEILYERACSKLAPEEIREIESNIE